MISLILCPLSNLGRQSMEKCFANNPMEIRISHLINTFLCWCITGLTAEDRVTFQPKSSTSRNLPDDQFNLKIALPQTA